MTWLNPWLLIVLNKKAAVRTIWTVIHFHLLSGHEISQNLYMQVICLPKSPLGFIEEELCGVWSIYSVTFPYGELRHICFPGHVLLCCFTCPSGTDWQTLQTNNFSSLGCQEYLSCIPLGSNISAFPPKAAQWGENPSDPRGHLKLSRYLRDIELILRTEAHKPATYPANAHIQTAYTQMMPLIHIHTKIVFDDNKSGVEFM